MWLFLLQVEGCRGTDDDTHRKDGLHRGMWSLKQAQEGRHPQFKKALAMRRRHPLKVKGGAADSYPISFFVNFSELPLGVL